MNPFTLSIETTVAIATSTVFHLGIDEKLARQIAKEKFHARRKHDLPVVSVGLMRLGRMLDWYDGDWGSRLQSNPSSQVRDAGRGNSEQRSHVHESTLFSRPTAAAWASAACGDRVEGKSHCARMKFPA